MTNTQAARFTAGQQVRIIANHGGLYAAQIGLVGVIGKLPQKRRFGYRYYHVSYTERRTRPVQRIVIVREDDLEAVANEADAAIPEELVPKPEEFAAKPDKLAAQPPKFSRGEHVTVDQHSALAYEAFTRGGAVGVIVGVGTPVRGIRRYDVRYAADTPAAQRAVARNRMGLLPLAQIREEHLLAAESPAPQRTATLQHAYEYRRERREKGLRADEPLWCDKGGCFEADCVVCQQTPEWRMRHGLKPPDRLRQRPQPTAPTSASAAIATAPQQVSLWGSEVSA